MALKNNQTLAELQANHAQCGRLEWIGLRPAHRHEIEETDQAILIAGQGIKGDHYAENTSNGNRQVTLLQAEHLPVIAILLGRDVVSPRQLRRNLLLSGINLSTLKDRTFRLGEAVLEGTGYCHPCSRMEENLGRGGYNAVRGLGGITVRVVQGGRIAVGDLLVPKE
ncbi:MAG: MOSC domain-containing protein [Gammaproteobacteria bacterium]|nr:MOSC domain-containing protein [Gammaproteobacteria bacterium]